MKITNKLLLVVFFISGLLQAQTKDSLWIIQNSFYKDLETRLFQTPLLFTQQKLGDFTQTQLQFEQKDLNFKRVQTAEKATAYSFLTKGIYNVKPKLRLFGSFEYNQMREQGLGYNLSTQRTEDQNVLAPNYFLAPKKGNWDSQHYKLKGGVSYELVNHILLGAVVQYANDKNYRKIDPRPEITVSDYSGELHAGYAYENHRIFVSGGLGKRAETTDIIYVDATLNAPAYPETFTTFSSGYGRNLFNPTYNEYIFKTLDRNFGLGYQFQNERSTVGITYKFNKGMQDLYSKDANSNIYYDESLVEYRYRTLSHRTQINYYHDGDKLDYRMQLGLYSDQGDNFSVVENGQNFRSNVDLLQFKSGIIKKEGHKVLYNLEFNAGITKHKYIDLLGSIDKRLRTLDLGVVFNKDLLATASNTLNLEVGINRYTVLKESLLYVPIASNTTFIDEVIYPDHAFDSASKWQSAAKVNYYIQLPKKKTLQIFSSYQTLTGANTNYLKYYAGLNTKFSNTFAIGIAVNY